MSTRRVLDSYGVLTFLEGEVGADAVAEMLKHARDREKPLLMSVVNWGEVFYITRRTAGEDAAEAVIRTLETLPIEVVSVEKDLARLAAEFKSTRKMSYADCFAAALAKSRNAELVTGDKEFREVEREIRIRWI